MFPKKWANLAFSVFYANKTPADYNPWLHIQLKDTKNSNATHVDIMLIFCIFLSLCM